MTERQWITIALVLLVIILAIVIGWIMGHQM